MIRSLQVARAMLLEDPNTVSSVESYVMQVLVQLDLDGCILVRLCCNASCWITVAPYLARW
jgi:hypothetical protein